MYLNFFWQMLPTHLKSLGLWPLYTLIAHLVWSTTGLGVSGKIPRAKVYLSIVNMYVHMYMYNISILLAIGLWAVVVVLACAEHLFITQVLDYLIADVFVYENNFICYVKAVFLWYIEGLLSLNLILRAISWYLSKCVLLSTCFFFQCSRRILFVCFSVMKEFVFLYHVPSCIQYIQKGKYAKAFITIIENSHLYSTDILKLNGGFPIWWDSFQKEYKATKPLILAFWAQRYCLSA